MMITPRVRRPNRDRALRHLQQQMYDSLDHARRDDPPLVAPPNPLAEAMAAFWTAFRAPLPSLRGIKYDADGWIR